MVTDQVKIRPGLQTLGCTVAAASAYCGPPMVKQKISQQQLNQIVNGYVDADADQVSQILSVLHTMEYLQETITPRLPIRWAFDRTGHTNAPVSLLDNQGRA
jgi:hypothetical protein